MMHLLFSLTAERMNDKTWVLAPLGCYQDCSGRCALVDDDEPALFFEGGKDERRRSRCVLSLFFDGGDDE
jgi:hypothetical protein